MAMNTKSIHIRERLKKEAAANAERDLAIASAGDGSRTKPETLYSRADWKFHKNRLGYDDVIDAKGRLVATVSVMDLAVSEMLQASYLEGGVPKELFILEADGCWSVYVAVPWLAPAKLQGALQRLGQLLGRTFAFDPYHLPERLEARYRREAQVVRESAKRTVPAADLLAKLKSSTAAKEPKRRLPSDKGMAALLTQKLKA
jgi:hypothetical protein